MSHLIVGLGNPGLEYDGTRHNVAWDVLDKLSFFSDLNWRDKFKGLYADKSISGEKFHFLKPMTFMNLSGQSVLALTSFFKVVPENILVIHDELDLPLGTIAYKKGGGLAGHNGLKSISESIGTKDFCRLRVGIGRPPRGSVSSWVLSRFSSDELITLNRVLEEVSSSLDLYFRDGFSKAASKYSRMKIN
jgi:PTH1 family peptidyl-tRNA hydrolase